jgi:c-di-GMP-binding flagellar brake protein YcgR
MKSQRRQYSRIKCHSHCQLMDRDGNTYQGLLGDISLGGALVKVNGDTPLQIGDLCDLMFSKKSAVFPLKRTGKIIRSGSRNMGISFIT